MTDQAGNKPFVERRKRLLVNADIQYALIRQLIYQWLLVLAVIAAVLLCLESYKSDFSLSVYECVAAMCSHNAALLITLGILAPVMIYESIRLSHRFVGPMISFRRTLARLGDGEQVAPLRFRKSDYWQDLAEHVNRVVERLERLEADRRGNPATLASDEPAEVGTVSQG